MNGFNTKNEKKIAFLEESLKEVRVEEGKIDDYKRDQETRKMFLQESLAVLKDKLSNALTNINILNADLNVSESKARQLNVKISNIKKEIKKNNTELEKLCSPKQLTSIDKEFVLTCNLYLEIEKVLADLLSELNSTNGKLTTNNSVLATLKNQEKEYRGLFWKRTHFL